MSAPTSRSWAGFLLLELAPILLVGLAVFFLLCRHVADVYPVPSASMEPTIHGDRRRGDRVLVDKLAYRFRRPQPFDLVVIRGEHPGDNLVVKRCAVLAADHPLSLRIQDGDLYRPDANGSFPADALPIVKDPVTYADLRVPVFRHPQPACEQSLEEFMRLPPGTAVGADGAFALAAAAPDRAALVALLDPARRRPAPGEMAPDIPGFLATNKPVDTSYLTPAGRRVWRDVNFYPDIGIDLQLAVGGDRPAVLFVLEYRDRDYGLLWDASGIQLVIGGTIVPGGASAGAGLRAGLQRVVFGYQDGHLFLLRGSDKLFYAPVKLDRNQDYRRPNRLHVGLGGARPATVRRIEVFHDLAVTRVAGAHGTDDRDHPVPANHMFLLGDNPHDSLDSRSGLGPVPIERLVGRPAAIVAPAERARWFVR